MIRVRSFLRKPWVIVPLLLVLLVAAVILRRSFFHEGDGAVVRGNAEGPWTLRYPGGARRSEGSFHLGIREGTWTYWYENGKRAASGDFLHGSRVGDWTFWLSDGRPDWVSTYEAGNEVRRSDPPPHSGDPAKQLDKDVAEIAQALPLRAEANQALAVHVIRQNAVGLSINPLMDRLRALPVEGNTNAAEALIATWPDDPPETTGGALVQGFQNLGELLVPEAFLKAWPPLPTPGSATSPSFRFEMVRQILADPQLTQENAHAVTRALARLQHPKAPDPDAEPGIGIQDAFQDVIHKYGVSKLSEGVKREAARVMDAPQSNSSAEQDRMECRRLLREAGY